ncbi:plastocyanin/azurin family copper-binding protein [Dehalococcoidia bacterium]|nr:plastocyanin/azurin family copper-binding protein [Dehalococcoidia bacterium]
MQLSTKYIGRSVSSIKGARLFALPLLLVTMIVLAGCSIGSYPLDFFQEMHYGQNYRVQEEPRLDRPASATAFEQAGGANGYFVVNKSYENWSFAEIVNVESPVSYDASGKEHARNLYRINCAGCHGVDGTGLNPDGGQSIPNLLFSTVVQYPVRFVDDPDTETDERDSIAVARTIGELYWLISCGTESLWAPHDKSLVSHGNTPSHCETGVQPNSHPNEEKPRGNMPAFSKFLSEEDRWLLAHLIEEMKQWRLSTTPKAAPVDSSVSSDGHGTGGSAGHSIVLSGADDFKFSPSSLTALAGDIDVSFSNTGFLDHSFVIEGEDFRLLPATQGGTEEAHITLAAGSYTFFCDIPGHREAGMAGELKVE